MDATRPGLTRRPGYKRIHNGVRWIWLQEPTHPLYRMTDGGNVVRRFKPSKTRQYRLRKVVYLRDSFTCYRCGKIHGCWPDYDGTSNVGTLSLDHIIPYRDGGEFSEENLRAACSSCNSSRGARSADD